ncbi:MAG: S1 RNA-binding domain-containing protein [Synergistaceae bacterium]|nr:S1 RNA-binding domain-containing protein [Synergistaceae bacterium]MBQ6737085.1 S1 RNA-binding domain-containing protein [Synergistaceae bacterium]MBR0075801.1 S1 RNA-binding domain-containing protein [Synergistaceae bacterium]MBR0079757.1 S1 RNA-binding domain-containing protein [Synergistaceae bacterium]MBR0253306.1 S1 RNA-binding domain-containing protein [Synergistaceae bacterium]
MNEAINTSAGVNVETGEIVECTVEQIVPYGAFVRITKNGKKGMIHISELSYSFVKDISEILKISDTVQAKIIRIDDRGRIDLSLKQASEPPQPQKFVKNSTPSTASSGEIKIRENVRPVRDFYEMREKFRESNPEEADNFEKKIASFLKVSDAKITDLNSRQSARSGRNARRRREH